MVLGLTYKENVPDTRNSKAKELILELQKYGLDVSAHDPLLLPKEIEEGFNATPIDGIKGKNQYDGFILFSPHEEFLKKSKKILDAGTEPFIFLDVKNALKEKLSGEEKVDYLAL